MKELKGLKVESNIILDQKMKCLGRKALIQEV